MVLKFVHLRTQIFELKVAVNTRLLLKGRMDGIPRFIHETTRRMVLANPAVEFHFLFDRAYDPQFVYADNVIPHVLHPQARHPILWYLWFEHSVRRFLDKNNIDVFYSGDMYLSLGTKVKTLYVSHDLNYIHYPKGLKFRDRKYLQYYFPKFHRRADHIIAVSEFTKMDIVKQLGIKEPKISVAYNATPDGFDIMSEEGKDKVRQLYSGGKPFFFFVGSLHPRKNLTRLLAAFDKFKMEKGSEHRLIIYGRRAFKTGEIFSVYEKMRYKEDVIFIDNDDCSVQDIMPAATALCYPSIFEGFGIPILEAFSCGVPVITSNVSSMPEVAGTAAILIDPFKIEDISDAMNKSLNTSVTKPLIEQGLQRIHKFSWKSSAQIIYSKLLELADQ